MDPTAIVVGHSFVKRYAKWIGTRHSMAPRHHMEICGKLKDLEFLGQSGLQSSELGDEHVFHASKYDIVILDCASNDLANGISIKTVVNNLLVFARRCIQDGATIVYIVSALNRARRISSNSQDFAQTVRSFNNHLRQLCYDEDNISFHRIAGFTQQHDSAGELPIENWSDDSIHPSPYRRQPNQKSGMEKYHQALKTALHRAAQRFQTLKSQQ